MPTASATLPELLEAVQAAARARDRADDTYRQAITHAYEELEQQGSERPYAAIAQAAGISRQAVWQMLGRARRDA